MVATAQCVREAINYDGLVNSQSSHENERCENNEEREEDKALVMAGARTRGRVCVVVNEISPLRQLD